MFKEKQPGEFLNLEVKVFKNKRNGQRTLILPKKILKDIPKKMDIKIPVKYFKLKTKTVYKTKIFEEQ